MRKIILHFVLMFIFVVGCSSAQGGNGNNNKDTKELTKEEQNYIQLVLNKKYEQLNDLTISKSNNLQEKYNTIAVALTKFQAAQKTEKEKDNISYKFNGLQLKYSSIVKSLNQVTDIPKELENQIEKIKTISLEKDKYYSEMQADQTAKIKRERELAEIKAQNEINGIFGTPKTVVIGMTAEEVLSIGWGKPNDINRTITAYGTREQWVYGNGNYLYFEDGILTSIQN
jgi:hypothetical protein